MCLFVPTRTAPDARKHWRLGKPGQKLTTELCLFVPAPKVVVPRLRRGELSGVKWEDIDFGERKLTPRRSIVKQHVGAVKTEKSKNSIPLFRQPTDWVFASPVRQGKFPFWGQALLRHYIRPAAVKAGITKRIGWHTFRHSYSTLLKASGADIKVMQELLRHASTRVTLDTYTQAVTPAKRAAQTVLGAARNTLLCPRCVLH
jgi:integrase